MLSLEGKRLGNYEVIRRIRVGGMGAVYEGKQRTAFDRRVAIKVILGDYAADRAMRRRFAREARTVARLHHPHILPLIEFGEEQGMLYLVMPFIDGGTLTSYLRRSLPPLSEIADVYQQLLDAVEYAHDAGLIHRDIKSSNVLLEQRRSGAPYVYLADFGLVRTSRQAELEHIGKPIPLDQVPGTPHYMAPEQTRGIITSLTDIYALGVLLYQMLTGELPYTDEDDVRVIQMHMHAPIPSPCDHDSSIPVELDEVVRIAMAKHPEDRFQSIAELRAAFLDALKGPLATVQKEDLLLEQEYVPYSPRKQSSPLPRQELPAPLPTPLPLPRRVHNAAAAIGVRERQERQHTTETIRHPRDRQRITEEPVPLRRHHMNVPLLATMAVPVVLLILLLMPRVLGVSFFPSGFPIFGTPPVATVLVTAQSKTFQHTYVLTASPRTTTPDLATHAIPDRLLQATALDSRTVQTTGTKTIAGTQAHGAVLFVNSTKTHVTIAPIILTSSSGVRIELTQSVQVPPRQNGQDGKSFAAAVAVNSGANGNIAAHILDGTCCGNGIAAQNLDAFSGGADAQTVHVVAQSDLDGVQSTLAPQLQQQAGKKMQHQLTTDEVMAGNPTYNTTVSSDSSIGTQVDQVRVQISVSGSVSAYNRNVMSYAAAQLLSQEAAQTLGPGYQPQGAPSIALSNVAAQGKSGLIYLNVSVRGLWVYAFSDQQTSQWRQTIKGATSTAALAYLDAQQGVAGVQIHLPFEADHFPTSNDEIKIVVVDNNTTL